MNAFGTKNIVCFGGGTGLPALLSGLKQNAWINATAIVNMFDSGGSSAVLRDRFGILPPGDVMRCLLALAEDEPAARKILLKRIEHREMPGHTGGNLLLFALERVYGTYADALNALAQILHARGTVIPVSLGHSSLHAAYEDGTQAAHEVEVDAGMRAGKRIARVHLSPSVRATDEAVEAIRQADVLVVGPGSLYTSVLPTFLPEGIREAVRDATAPVIFVCNLLTEGAGMHGIGVARSAAIAEEYVGRPFDAIICNRAFPEAHIMQRYAAEHKAPILPGPEDALLGERLVAADVWTDGSIARHDSDRLAGLVYALAQALRKTGTRV